MCLVSLAVKNIAKTKILVGTNKDKNQQITIYSNVIDNNSNNNAMILPVPYPETIKFINLSNYKDIFSDCQSVFMSPRSRGEFLSASFNYDGMSKGKLEVLSIGSYKVSLAKSLQDLRNVDETVFELSAGCEEVLSKTYTENYWGFIICKLAKGNEEYHPLAYSHKILNNKVFIPTKHYHQHQHQQEFKDFRYNEMNIDNSPMFNLNLSYMNNVADKIADDWDHDIYLYNVGQTSGHLNGVRNTNIERWNGKNNLNLDKINFDFSDLVRFDKLTIHGNNPNIDLQIPVK